MTRLILILLLVLVPIAKSHAQPSAQPESPRASAPAAPSTAQPKSPAVAPSPTASAPVASTAARLSALEPRSPWAYFELGEEIAAEAADPATKSLARTLFVLAYETAKHSSPEQRSQAAGADIRISVCLALATISSSESEQRWLLAIASSLGWNGTQAASGASAGQSPVVDPAALELATALGLIRIGDGRRAARLLDKPEVSRLLDQSERLLSPAGLTGGAARVRRLMAEWPICTECKNRRFVKSQEGVRICPTCAGKPGPKLPQQELLYQLRLESSLLHGVQRSWVAQTVVDGGAPLRDLDPDELAATYRVDPARTLWRNGSWVAPAPAIPSPNAPATKPESRP